MISKRKKITYYQYHNETYLKIVRELCIKVSSVKYENNLFDYTKTKKLLKFQSFISSTKKFQIV